jgi:hypothetical protein
VCLQIRLAAFTFGMARSYQSGRLYASWTSRCPAQIRQPIEKLNSTPVSDSLPHSMEVVHPNVSVLLSPADAQNGEPHKSLTIKKSRYAPVHSGRIARK